MYRNAKVPFTKAPAGIKRTDSECDRDPTGTQKTNIKTRKNFLQMTKIALLPIIQTSSQSRCSEKELVQSLTIRCAKRNETGNRVVNQIEPFHSQPHKFPCRISSFACFNHLGNALRVFWRDIRLCLNDANSSRCIPSDIKVLAQEYSQDEQRQRRSTLWQVGVNDPSAQLRFLLEVR